MGIARKPICVCLGVALFGTESLPVRSSPKKKEINYELSIFNPEDDKKIMELYPKFGFKMAEEFGGRFTGTQVAARANFLGVKKEVNRGNTKRTKTSWK